MDAVLSARHKLKLRKWSRNMQLGQSSCVQQGEAHCWLEQSLCPAAPITTGSLVSTAGCEAPHPPVPGMQGPETGCHAFSGRVYGGMRLLPSCSPSPFPLLSCWCTAGPPSGPESKNFASKLMLRNSGLCYFWLQQSGSMALGITPYPWPSQLPLPALDLLHTHHMLPVAYWVAMQSREQQPCLNDKCERL